MVRAIKNISCGVATYLDWLSRLDTVFWNHMCRREIGRSQEMEAILLNINRTRQILYVTFKSDGWNMSPEQLLYFRHLKYSRSFFFYEIKYKMLGTFRIPVRDAKDTH